MHLSEHSVILTCTPKEINRRIRLKVTSFDAGKSSSKLFWVFFSSSCLSRNFLSSVHLLYFFVFRKVFPFLLQNRQVKKMLSTDCEEKTLNQRVSQVLAIIKSSSESYQKWFHSVLRLSPFQRMAGTNKINKNQLKTFRYARVNYSSSNSCLQLE